MAEYNWSQFTTRIPISKDIETLYRAWATRSGIEHWFLKFSEFRGPDHNPRGMDQFVEPGDTYTWRWHGWGNEIEETGKIIDCNGKDFFKFTFSDAGICSVSIKEESETTVVELIQTEIPTDPQSQHRFHLGCKTGWTFYLANLKSLMEGGIDLRNKSEEIKRVINS